MARGTTKLIFVDAENQQIRIIDNEVRLYGWNEIQQVADEISGSEVLYITSLDRVNGTDIVEMLSEHTGKRYVAPVRTGRKYLHTSRPGKVIVPHEDSEYEPLVFDSPIDFKPFSEKLYTMFPTLRRYMELDRIEIVDEGDMPRIRKEYNSKVGEVKRRQQSAKDQSLDSILVQDSAKRIIDRIENEGYSDGLDSEELDITDDVNAAEDGLAEESDFYRTAKEAGIDIDNMDE